MPGLNIDSIPEFYKTQSRNVRYLKQVQNVLRKDINKSIARHDDFSVKYKTLQFAQLYSALSEAQFLQILYTPNGFQLSEIENIQNQSAIFDSWKLMVEIAFGRLNNWKGNPDFKNRNDKINKYISDYIEKPQLIRNKIAHGQWLYAFNSDNSNINTETTYKIKDLNITTISIWFEVHQYLCFIIRDLIQSPSKGFHNNYWTNLSELETYLSKTSSWSFSNRVKKFTRPRT